MQHKAVGLNKDRTFYHSALIIIKVVSIIAYNNIIIIIVNTCTACTQGDIRLVGGARDSEGRVEVCNQNQWGSVCDVSWDINDASVACRQAGFGSGKYKFLIVCLQPSYHMNHEFLTDH